MATATLYENINSGSVVCEKHLGMEASARFSAKPNAKSVMTSFGKIAKMSDADATEWINYVAERYPNGCESCR